MSAAVLIEAPFWADAAGDTLRGWAEILFGGGRWIRAWPPSEDTLGGKLNAATRLVLYATAVVAFLVLAGGAGFASSLLVLIVGAVSVASIVAYYRYRQRRAMVVVPVAATTAPMTVSGFETGVKDPVNNPYGNPMPYEPGIAVRSSVPPMEYYQDDCLAHMYRGTSEWDQNLFFNRIPDPTLVARNVFWPQDPRPDIVSNEAACGDRKCR